MTINALDRVLLQLAPRYAKERIRARAIAETMVRHYEAAQGGRRTENFTRRATDANSANQGALHALRDHARDLVRNNPWARRGKQIIANNTVSWGIKPKPIGEANGHAVKRARALWNAWAETTQCDIYGQRDIYGLQRLAMDTIAESGEVLVRRYRRPISAGLAIPLQLQLLEPDHLDTTRDGIVTEGGNRILQGIEFDLVGRRVAYWLFPRHPGASFQYGTSRLLLPSVRVPAADVLHAYHIDRIGQARGITFFASVIVKLKDFDEYEDATLLRQKIAACFAAFVVDHDGAGVGLGEKSVDDPLVETIEPGLIYRMPVSKTVEFANPPTTVEGKFDERQLRAIASGIGVTYEDLTGDFSRVNFSSARMSRLAHYANVHDWRWNMLIPMFCTPIWGWAMETAAIAGAIGEGWPLAKWMPAAMPMIEPDKEGLAYQRNVRNGTMTHDEMILEQGGDPDTHWDEYAAGLRRLDTLGITLDTDARKTSQAGNQTVPKPAAKPAAA